ncbi:hypothetical protein JCM10003_1761 [Bacteroides pyogenes JCM 10003]|nr:hypothetical protein JCM10003_1761 [Bacteroides pyogenes JCM 10003]
MPEHRNAYRIEAEKTDASPGEQDSLTPRNIKTWHMRSMNRRKRLFLLFQVFAQPASK